jgi:predicted nucleic acid-binding Zn ribbon protein
MPANNTSDKSPEPVSEVLARYLQQSGWTNRLRQRELLAAWEEVVGPDIAAHAHVSGLRGCTLYVDCESSAFRHDLELFYKESLLESLSERIGSAKISDIRFRMAGKK